MRLFDWFLAMSVMALPVSFFLTLVWLSVQGPRKARPPREYQPGDIFDEIV